MHQESPKQKAERDLPIFIENPKGSYKSFGTEGDPDWGQYPLKGVTYPVDYGYIEGYRSEDDHDLDVFVGTGEVNGLIRLWRLDVPIETKFILGVNQKEWDEIVAVFRPVITETKQFADETEFRVELEKHRRT